MLEKEQRIGEDGMRHVEKSLMLRILDEQWKEHLASMDYLRQGIGLRGYAQKNPKQEYKREAYAMFTELLDEVKYTVSTAIARLRIPTEEEMRELEEKQRALAEEQRQNMNFIHEESAGHGDEETESQQAAAAAAARQGNRQQQTVVRQGKKVGRNDACPCGSGKKYKQCPGKLS